MNSGREPGPEDPRGSRPPPDVPSGENEETDWPTWRQGAGYSRPTPPDTYPEHRAEQVALSPHDNDTHAGPDPGSGSGQVGDSRRPPGHVSEPWPRSVQPGQSRAAGPGRNDPTARPATPSRAPPPGSPARYELPRPTGPPRQGGPPPREAGPPRGTGPSGPAGPPPQGRPAARAGSPPQ